MDDRIAATSRKPRARTAMNSLSSRRPAAARPSLGSKALCANKPTPPSVGRAETHALDLLVHCSRSCSSDPLRPPSPPHRPAAACLDPHGAGGSGTLSPLVWRRHHSVSGFSRGAWRSPSHCSNHKIRVWPFTGRGRLACRPPSRSTAMLSSPLIPSSQLPRTLPESGFVAVAELSAATLPLAATKRVVAPLNSHHERSAGAVAVRQRLRPRAAGS